MIGPQEVVDRVLDVIGKKLDRAEEARLAQRAKIGGWAHTPAVRELLEKHLDAALKKTAEQIVASNRGERAFDFTIDLARMASAIWERQNQNLKASVPVENIAIALAILAEEGGWPVEYDGGMRIHLHLSLDVPEEEGSLNPNGEQLSTEGLFPAPSPATNGIGPS